MQAKNAELKRMFSKFDQIKLLDIDYKPSLTMSPLQLPISPEGSQLLLRPVNKQAQKKADVEEPTQTSTPNDLIYTQSEISKEVAKLKPYLATKNDIMTSEELEEKRNKEISQQNYKMMSELAILENRKLCEVVDLERQEDISEISYRDEKEKEGWIFEIFYRSSNSLREDLSRKPFLSGFAVMTQTVEIYESLTFQKLLVSIIPSAITMVRYSEENTYQVITVEQGSTQAQIGFLNQKKFDLFDRMLFLQKNMSRSASTRLFQNQLIKSIYAEYEK